MDSLRAVPFNPLGVSIHRMTLHVRAALADQGGPIVAVLSVSSSTRVQNQLKSEFDSYYV